MNPLEQLIQLSPELRENLARILVAALALALIWLLRKVLAAIFVAPLRRLAGRSEARWDDLLLDTIIIPARLLIIAFGLAVSAEILQLDVTAQNFIQHLIRTFVIAALFMAFYRAVNALAPTSTRLFSVTGLSISERLLPFIRTTLKIIIVVLAGVVVIQEWGYDITGLVAGLGVTGLGISLAAQDTIKNLFGFTMIVSDQPFVVGDFIKTNDVEGTVEHVGVRSTRVRQPDQAYVTVPNSTLANSAILNWSRLSKRWINVTLRITYDTRRESLENLLAVLREMLAAREHVDSDSIVVHFINFGDAGLELLIRCYVKLADWGEFTAEKELIYLEIMGIIEALGLHIAFPARPVYSGTAPPPQPGGASPKTTEET